MYNIKYVKEFEVWAVVDKDDRVVVYSETRDGAIDTMRYMNENL